MTRLTVLIAVCCLAAVVYVEVITYHHAWNHSGDFHYDIHILRKTGVPDDAGVDLDDKATAEIKTFIMKEIQEADQPEGENNQGEGEKGQTAHHTGHKIEEPGDEANKPQEPGEHDPHHPKHISPSKEKEDEKEREHREGAHHKKVTTEGAQEEANDTNQPEETNGETLRQKRSPKEEDKERVESSPAMNKQAARAFVDLKLSSGASHNTHTEYHLVIITVDGIPHAVGHKDRKSAHEIIAADHEIASKHWQHWFRAATNQMISVMTDNPQSHLEFGGAYKEHEDKLVYLFAFKLTGLQSRPSPVEQQQALVKQELTKTVP